MTLLRSALLLGVLAALPGARAAGLDCAAAASPTERAICADERLRALDATLATAYVQALEAAGASRDALRERQRDWLRARDACDTDAKCIASRYWHHLGSFIRPDASDMAALEALRVAVNVARQRDPEFPFERAIAPLTIGAGTTTFVNTKDDDDADGIARFPRNRPSGVTDAEWRALQASRVEGGGENGNSQYTLADLDGDGLRDLIVKTYAGGTAAFTVVGILRQEDDKFVVPGFGKVDIDAVRSSDDEAAQLLLYSARSENADVTWVRLHGRVYALFRDSEYGADHVSLLRPWGSRGEVPQLTIRYRYRLSAPALQSTRQWDGPPDKPAFARLALALHRGLNRALASVHSSAADNRPNGKPLCPIPADAPDEVRESSVAYWTAPNTIATVADLPVWVGKQCYLGQMNNWLGRYDRKTGLEADLCVRKAGTLDTGTERCYTVQGRRTATKVTAGTALMNR